LKTSLTFVGFYIILSDRDLGHFRVGTAAMMRHFELVPQFFVGVDQPVG
jgi:hypothetical protein